MQIQTRLKLFVLVVLCSIVVTILVSYSRPQSYRGQQRQTESFKLELCNCTRTLVIPLTSTAKINTSTIFPQQIGFNSTTCGWSAYQRGSHQKIVGFSFYGNSNSSVHNAKQYFVGIKENLEKMTELYGEDWVMRLYYDLEPSDQQLMGQLCDLACANNNIDLCNIRQLPGTPVRDATEIFAMNWRFFPTLDPQVDLYLCRDLDSRFSQREVDAVDEWLESEKPLHAMRDHPAHNTPLLGASWGARLDQPHGNIRHKWTRQVYEK